MGSIKPDGDKCSEDYQGFCTMMVKEGQLHLLFEEETSNVIFELEEAEFFHEKLTEAIGVMKDAIQSRSSDNAEGSTDT